MNWTFEQIEDTLNYIRVVLGGTVIWMFHLDNDSIGYHTADGCCCQRSFYRIYKEMLDKQKEI